MNSPPPRPRGFPDWKDEGQMARQAMVWSREKHCRLRLETPDGEAMSTTFKFKTTPVCNPESKRSGE